MAWPLGMWDAGRRNARAFSLLPASSSSPFSLNVVRMESRRARQFNSIFFSSVCICAVREEWRSLVEFVFVLLIFKFYFSLYLNLIKN